jgi:phosphoribosylformylglycinamidine cyclo-ligase
MIERWDLDLGRPFQEQLRLSLGDRATDPAMATEPQHALATLGEVLLTPSTIYAPLILALRATLAEKGSELRGVAHITGGGLPGNVPRMLPPHLGARIDPSRWPVPSVIALIAALAGIDDEEMRATFNAGLGMVLTVPPRAASDALGVLRSTGASAWIVGDVVDAAVTGPGRYTEGTFEPRS